MYLPGLPVPVLRARGLSSVVVLFAALNGSAAVHAQDTAGQEIRYVHASQLNLRAEPSLASPALTRLRINDMVTLRGKSVDRWCVVETRDGPGLTGHVDCSFLGQKALTLEKLELDFAAQALALHRLIRRSDQAPASSLDSLPRERHEQATHHVEQLFQLVERHFALSPSFYAYGDYEELIRFLQQFDGGNNTDSSSMPTFAKARLAQLRAMEEALSQDYAAQSAPRVSAGIDAALKAIVSERGATSTNPDLTRSRKREERQARLQQRAARNALDLPARPSFFQQGRWAVGWAGGPLVRRRRMADPGGVVYDVAFNGSNVQALANVYEMAKAQRQAVKVEFTSLSAGELAQMTPSPQGGYRGAVVQLRLPVWAVTASGLIQGHVRRVSFGGDACSNGAQVATAAEVVFPQPVRDKIQAVFSTNADIDPTKVKIQLRKRAFLEGGGDTLTGRVDVSVDIDGDGVADLRTVVSHDYEVSAAPVARPMLVRWDGGQRPSHPYLWRVAGWYANDVFALEANMGQAWQILSYYSVSTCT